MFLLFNVQRLDTELAATIIQLYLWAPSSWIKKEGYLPSSNEVSRVYINNVHRTDSYNNMLRIHNHIDYAMAFVLDHKSSL